MRIIVVGGGMCGAAAALMLADDGHDVAVIERDPAPPPPTVDAAFADWRRRGVGQFSLAHLLMPAGTAVMKSHLPEVYQRLENHGGLHLNIVTYLLTLQGVEATPDDEARYDHLTGRRSTLEWVLATTAEQHPCIAMRRGEAVKGLLADRDGAVPRVTGLALESGESLAADLVVDATGRRSPTPGWLEDIGGGTPIEDEHDCGFSYTSRYYRSDDGSTPAILGPLLSPYESFSILTLPADNGTWSTTVYGLTENKALRAVRDPDAFERVVRACPLQAHWVDAEPIGEMSTMAGAVDRHREFVVAGTPCATGLLTVGDAASCTNPSLGRGITLGWKHVAILRDVIAARGHDPDGLAMEFHERSESELRPFHDATTMIDRRRVEEMRAGLTGTELDPDPAAHRRAVLQAAMSIDPIAVRSFGDMFACYATTDQVFARPGLAEHIDGLTDRVSLEPLPGPNQAELEELLA